MKLIPGSEKESMVKKNKSPHINFPIALWERLETKKEEEGIETMSEFIRHVCREYLKTDGFKNQREYLKTDGFKNQLSNDEDLENDKRIREQLRNEEYQFIANLNSLLQNIKNEEKPVNYEEKISQILTCIEKQKLDFHQIQEATQIPKEQLVVLIGNMVASGEIFYDNRWRFYKA